MSTTLNTRIITKHDTTRNWNNAIGFIPKKGEVIIYDDFKTIEVEENGVKITKFVPGIKVGTGNGYVQDLAFVSDDIRDELIKHIKNQEIHVTLGEKAFWSNKVNIDDSKELIDGRIEGETLIFNRN